jgi:hypothetical protein
MRTVIATELFAEKLPGGHVHIHADRGDPGTIVHVDAEGVPTVWWHHSGTATSVYLGVDCELAALA